jgi:hypothetical protein
MESAQNGTEETMTKLVSKMPEVAHRALCNSMTSVGHPESKEHWVRYNFMCLQNQSTGKLGRGLKSNGQVLHASKKTTINAN